MSGFVEQQQQAWSAIYHRFKSNETPNGPGSTLAATEEVRRALPQLIARHGITTMLDAPCGDFHWLQHVDLGGVRYIGWDVQHDMIVANQERFPDHTFIVHNLLTAPAIPAVDLILCRDFAIHLPNDAVSELLDKFVASGSRYLLSTSTPGADNDRPCPPEGHDGRPGYWHHPIDLQAPPFSLSGAVEAIDEVGGHQLVLFDLDRSRS